MKYLVILVVVMLSTVLSLGAITTASADKLKVGFIYIGPPGDHGWTYSHDQGRLMIDNMLGDHVETTYVEGVPEGPDAERAIAKLAETGHKLIFTTSFGYMEPTLKVAKRFPDVKFEHATGYKQADNVATYSARFYEGRYVQGQIAAKISKSGIIGYIASFPIPEVVRGINAFMLGAQSINSDMKVKVVWAYTWFDPPTAAYTPATGNHLPGPPSFRQRTQRHSESTPRDTRWHGQIRLNPPRLSKSYPSVNG